MASQVDDTVPADNVKADKALFRENFRIIKEEITEVQRAARLPWQTAIGLIAI